MEEAQRDAVAQVLTEATAEKQNQTSGIAVNGNNNIVINGNSIFVPEKGIPEAQVALLNDLKDAITRLAKLSKISISS